jgi:hypothetical protein
MQGRGFEVQLIPTQVDQFGRSQPMPVRYKDHRRVSMRPPIAFCRRHEALDLSFRQVFAGS